ncbi:hypothetical protein KUTeg_024877 [Tegillarca granosa]|uniref:Uncharacterized protein n=1 Tax=Tegillarca granosa TaxID=220873 RepID=A0ABQ9E3P3_TEGGR|nr:hypothetical protein KUTeg_024877 [Tegillarca granosa]
MEVNKRSGIIILSKNIENKQDLLSMNNASYLTTVIQDNLNDKTPTHVIRQKPEINIPEDQRILDPKKGPIRKTAAVKSLPNCRNLFVEIQFGSECITFLMVYICRYLLHGAKLLKLKFLFGNLSMIELRKPELNTERFQISIDLKEDLK